MAGSWPGARSWSTTRCCAPRTWRSSCEPARRAARADGPPGRGGDRGRERVRRGPRAPGGDPQRVPAADRVTQVRPVGRPLPARARGADLAGAADVLSHDRSPVRPAARARGRAVSGWLEGRRALVVGAGSGIGRAVVDAFQAEGAHVAVLEKDEAKSRALQKDLPDVPVVTADATTRS